MKDQLGEDERAISEILGTILLISMVLLGSAAVVVYGSMVINDAEERTRTEAAADYLQVVDSGLATLSAGDEEAEVQFDPQDAVAREYHVDRDGSLRITVNSNPDCSFEQSLSTIVYEDSNGQRVGYEAGGVWRRGPGGGTAQITPPDVTLTNGRLTANLVNVTGTFDQARNRVRLNETRTRNRTAFVSSRLLNDDCSRPDDVEIRVQSQFYDGWANYLESETGVSPTVNHGSDTVTLTLGQDQLHPSANDEENNVVNLGGASYMHSVTISEGAPPELGVDKDANNTYMSYVGPVTNGSLDIGREISVEGANVTGPPLDVSLILDESGSMGNYADASCPGESNTKMGAARCEAQNFVGYINDTRDRVSVQSYNGQPRFRHVDGAHFASDFNEVNDTIDTIYQGGSTRIDLGLDASNSVFDLRGNETRRRISILLTDGRNNDCNPGDMYTCADNRRTREAAWQADNDSVTVFTIGFGSNTNEQLLKDVANATGGTYYAADNADDLADAFQNISERIQPKDAVANVPVTSNVTNSTGYSYQPEIPGNVSHVANNSNGLLNINDPTAPALFRHSFPLADGDTFDLNVTDYECADGAYNLTGETVTVGGETRSVARCTDIQRANQSFHGDIYVDGERPDTLLSTTYADWQTDVNESLKRFPRTSINQTTGRVNTTSNQAMVVYDLPPQGSGTRNTLVMLVRIGLAESDAQGTGIVTVRVSEAEIR